METVHSSYSRDTNSHISSVDTVHAQEDLVNSPVPTQIPSSCSSSKVNIVWWIFCQLFACCWIPQDVEDEQGTFSALGSSCRSSLLIAAPVDDSLNPCQQQTVYDTEDVCDPYQSPPSPTSSTEFILPPYNGSRVRRRTPLQPSKYSSFNEGFCDEEEGCFTTSEYSSHVNSFHETSAPHVIHSIPYEDPKLTTGSRKRKKKRLDSENSFLVSNPSCLSNALSAESGLGLDSISFISSPSSPSIHKHSTVSIPSPSSCSPTQQSILIYLSEEVEEQPSRDLITCCSEPLSITRRQSMESLVVCDEEEPQMTAEDVLEQSIGSLLNEIVPDVSEKICCVIDLDETLVHSSFEPLAICDFTVTIELEGLVFPVYVCKRPHVDDFLRVVADLFECVLFTASVSKYAEPVIEQLDPEGTIFQHRLFRESCRPCQGNYIKNLDDLGRSLKRTVILDNSPVCYYFHPRNAIPIATWFDDPNDCVLLELIPFFQRLSKAKDVLMFLEENSPPGLQYITPDDREYITAIGSTIFTRPIIHESTS